MSARPFSTSRLQTIDVDFYRPVYCVLGLPVDAVTLNSAYEHVYTAATAHRRCFLSTPNLNFAIACLDDSEFRHSVINSDLSTADGMPLVWIARLFGIPIPERVTGSGLFEKLYRQAGRTLSVYLFGGPDGAAPKAAERINSQATGLRCVGNKSPGFGSIEELSSEPIIHDINESHADFLIVALGAKKGQNWIERNRSRLRVPVLSHLGAVINFAAGSVKRAPKWMQRTGTEWLWRIKEEPMLWRRYLRDGAVLVRLMLTRVIPGALRQRLHAPDRQTLAKAWISFSGDQRRHRIKLHGAWCAGNLSRLRQGFDRLAHEQVDIEIDMSEVSFIDSAFIGLLMLMYGHQDRSGLDFNLWNVSPAMCAVFKDHCAEFLLQTHGVEVMSGREFADVHH